MNARRDSREILRRYNMPSNGKWGSGWATFLGIMAAGLFVAVVPQLHRHKDQWVALAAGLLGINAVWREWRFLPQLSFVWEQIVSRTFVILGIAWTFLIFLPIGGYLSLPLMVPPASGNADAIVVLAGGMTSAGETSLSGFQRALHGIELWKAGRAPRIVFSTGDIEIDGHTEKACVASLASLLSLPQNSFIILKDGITTTRTEAETIASYLRSQGISRILLVTNGPHILRATLTFAATGLEVLPAPVQTAETIWSANEDRIGLFRSAMHEWLGMGLYWWRGDLASDARKK